MQINPLPPNKPRLEQLDALRGLCALIVVAYHFDVGSLFFNNRFIHNGYLLVDFFFVLSGFVMFYNYSRLSDLSDLKRFMILRFFRLYPLHLLMLMVFLAYEILRWAGIHYLHFDANRPAFTDNNEFNFVLNLTLLNGVGLVAQPTFNIPSWTISAEFWTYLIFACLAIYSIRWKRSSRGALLLCASILSAGLLSLFSKTSPLSQAGTLALFRCGFSFFIGTLLASMLTSPRATALALASQKSPKVHLFAGSLIQCCCLSASVAAVEFLGRGSYELSIPLFYMATIASLCWFPGAIVSKVARSTPFLRLGRYSYSIYMVHLIIVLITKIAIRVVGHVKLAHDPRRPAYVDINYVPLDPLLGTVIFAGCLATVLVVSHFTFTYVEEPWRRFGKRWVANRALDRKGSTT